MSFNLEESSKNVVIITKEDSTSSSKNELKRRKSVDLSPHAFQLITNRIATENPTTNGFQTSTLDFTLNLMEPNLLLQNFDLLDDTDHQTLAEIKIIYQKMVSFLKKRGLTIESGYIREVIFADNDIDEEFTFLIEVVLKNVFNHHLNCTDVQNFKR